MSLDPRIPLYTLHVLVAVLAWWAWREHRRHLGFAAWATMLPLAALARRACLELEAPRWIARALYVCAPLSVAIVAVLAFARRTSDVQKCVLETRGVLDMPGHLWTSFGHWVLLSGIGIEALTLSFAAARRTETPLDLYYDAHLAGVLFALLAVLARVLEAQKEKGHPCEWPSHLSRIAAASRVAKGKIPSPDAMSSPDITDLSTAIIVAWWTADLAGPQLSGDPVARHWITQTVAFVALLLLVAAHAGALCRRRS